MIPGGRGSEDATVEGTTPASESPAPRPPLSRFVAAAPAIGGAFALAIYAATAAPGAWWGDGLELTVAAKVLGIPHPTGYPLYVWLGHLVLSIFSGTDPGLEMTLTSAALCALGAALTGAMAYFFVREGDAASGIGPASAAIDRGAAALLGLGVTLVVAFSRTLWDHATFAEVYPLTFFLVTGMMLGIVWPARVADVPGPARVLLLGVLLGLSDLNHYSAAAVGPAVLLSVIHWGRRRSMTGRYLFLLLAPFLLLMLGYAWIPWRAAQNPPLNFGNPDSLSGLIWVTGGGQYGQLQFLQGGLSLERMGAGARGWFEWWGVQMIGEGSEALAIALGAVVVTLALIGNLLLARRRWSLGIGAIVLIGATLVFAALYRIPDIDGYFLPAIPGVVLGGLELLRWLVARIPAAPARVAAAASLGMLAMLLGLALIRVHLPSVDKSWDRGPEVWAGNVMNALPEGALVLTRQGSDSEIYALWYAQMALDQRPDVSVYGTGFIFSGWYRSYFEAEGRPRIPVFAVDRPPGAKTEFDVALIGGVVVPNLRERRVFVTYRDPVLEEHFEPRPVARLLPPEYYARTAYKLNPPGPVLYELTRNLQIEPVALERFDEMFGGGGG